MEIPATKLRYFLFKKGYARMIDIPMKCKIPNIMNSWGIKIHVIAVMNNPSMNILQPLFRYFEKGLLCKYLPERFDLELLSDKETPIKNMNVKAVILAKNQGSPDETSHDITPKNARSNRKW